MLRRLVGNPWNVWRIARTLDECANESHPDDLVCSLMQERAGSSLLVSDGSWPTGPRARDATLRIRYVDEALSLIEALREVAPHLSSRPVPSIGLTDAEVRERYQREFARVHARANLQKRGRGEMQYRVWLGRKLKVATTDEDVACLAYVELRSRDETLTGKLLSVTLDISWRTRAIAKTRTKRTAKKQRRRR